MSLSQLFTRDSEYDFNHWSLAERANVYLQMLPGKDISESYIRVIDDQNKALGQIKINYDINAEGFVAGDEHIYVPEEGEEPFVEETDDEGDFTEEPVEKRDDDDDDEGVWEELEDGDFEYPYANDFEDDGNEFGEPRPGGKAAASCSKRPVKRTVTKGARFDTVAFGKRNVIVGKVCQYNRDCGKGDKCISLSWPEDVTKEPRRCLY